MNTVSEDDDDKAAALVRLFLSCIFFTISSIRSSLVATSERCSSPYGSKETRRAGRGAPGAPRVVFDSGVGWFLYIVSVCNEEEEDEECVQSRRADEKGKRKRCNNLKFETEPWENS